MSNDATIKKLGKLVGRYGAAQVSVWLGYRDTRSINVWLSTNKIPKSRIELVQSILKSKGA